VDQRHPLASDSNPGSETQPWETIQKAGSVLQAGDTVIVKTGDYTGDGTDIRYQPAIRPIHSGTAANPITFKAQGQVTVKLRTTETGLARGGTFDSIILAESASSVDDSYFGWYVRIVSGTGAGQYRRIQKDYYVHSGHYIGATRTAYVLQNWDIIPDATSEYALTRTGPVMGALSTDYIIFDGFKIIERDSYRPDTGSFVVWNSDHVTVQNCEIAGQMVELFDNHNGIRVNDSDNVIVRNNVIHGVTCVDSGVNNPQNHAGVMIYNSRDGLYENNVIYNCYTCFFPKGQYSGHVIRYNVMYNSAKGLRISYHTDVDFCYNLLYDMSRMAFQPAEVISNVRYYNNVVYNSYSGVNNWYAVGGFEMFNNVFLDVTYPMCFEAGSGTFYSNFNDYYQYTGFRVDNRNIGGLAAWKARGFDADSIEVDPMFVDAGGLDFHLQDGSTIASAGVDIADYDNDGDTTESIPMGLYVTGQEIIGLKLKGDLDKDGRVNYADVGLLSLHWLEQGGGNIADADGDGSVNMLDFAVIAGQWLELSAAR